MSVLSIGRPRFVSKEEALAYHAVSIAEYGGADGLRDAGALDSALAMPMQGFSGEYAHKFPFEMAAAYAFHIAKNHPFIDGNKRAALMCCGAFLRINGWNLIAEGTSAADTIVSLVENRIDKAEIAAWLEQNCRQRPSLELRDYFSVLSFSKVREFVRSVVISGDERELAATRGEACVAVPVIAEFLAALDDLRSGPLTPEQEGNLKLLEGNVMLLIALYRIAEDMGYEW